MEFYHEPIMINEIKEGLNLSPFAIFVDCTLGGAGHSSEIIKKIPNGKLIGIDKDNEALEYSKKRLKDYKNVIFVKNDFKNFNLIMDDLEINKIDGVLIDLGVSSHQLDTATRGFSFRFDGPLDMRMDKNQELTAFEVINFYSKEKLKKIIKEYGEEPFANLIVNNIVKYRKEKFIESTLEFKKIIEECLPKRYVYKSGGSDKKVFQAIRIEVNKELENLEIVINDIIKRLNKGGRLAVLTFHSLEDRLVKRVFKENSINCICPPETPICICNHKASIKLINRKPIIASEEEKNKNTRSTSAKLRIIEKL